MEFQSLENIMKIKLGELFCGPGGIGLGAHLAASDFEHAWAVDNHHESCQTYI